MFYVHPDPWGEMIQIYEHIFQIGWINHQPKNSKIAELGQKNMFILLDQGSDVSSLSMISFSSVAVTEMLGWWVNWMVQHGHRK